MPILDEHISVTARRGTLQEKNPSTWFKELFAINLTITANCNRSCAYCYAGSLRDSDLGDIPLSSILTDVGKLEDATCIQFTGGEPTCHGDFPLVAEAVRGAYSGKLAMFTNGFRLLKYSDVVNRCFDAVSMSVYDAEDEATVAAFLELKAPSVAFIPQRVVHRRKAVGVYPCWRLFGVVSVQAGRVYPCSVAHGLMGAASVELIPGWMERLLTVEAPCDGCVFACRHVLEPENWLKAARA